MFSTWGPRLLAPIFLIACAIAILTVVNANESSDTATTGQQAGQNRGGQNEGNQGGNGEDDGGEGSVEETYTVQAGDFFSSIAEETGVSQEKLERLNPDVDPTALQPGQVLKLR